MTMLKDKDRQEIGRLLADLTKPVRLVYFGQEIECEYCSVTREMLEELAPLSDRLVLEQHDLVKDEALAKSYGIDKVPALVVRGDEDPGIRLFGVPAGYEFTSLIEAILDVGGRGHRLPDEVVARLAAVDRPVHIQVMVTPT